MTKYIDGHTILTVAIVLALTAVYIAKLPIPEWLLVMAAAVSPGLVFKKPAAVEADPKPAEPAS